MEAQMQSLDRLVVASACCNESAEFSTMSVTNSSDLTGRARGGRKLIAVVYADMVGYSRLIGLDDLGTLERLRILRRTLIDPAINEHGGRIVQTGGDSLLIVFDSIDGAVRCAVSIQHQAPDYDDDQPPDRAIRFRVGINIGDVIADGTDLHGDGVNVAARLQAECPPGGICVSRAVRDHVHDRLDLTFEELGALSLKNISRPVEAFVVRREPEATEQRLLSLPRGAVATLPPIPNIPVTRKAYSRRVALAGFTSVLTVGLGGSVPAPWPSRPQTARIYAGAQRTALVIGNSRYKNLPMLANTERDAAMVSNALERHGFRVIKKIDADREVLVQAITDFETILSVVGGVGLFYYAGSAAYIPGADIILPVDATKDLAEMKIQGGINFTRLSAGIKTKITQKVVDNGSAVIYSASKGQEASDGPSGQNSPFARAFLAALDREEDELGDAFRYIRQAMDADQHTANQADKQTPYFEDSRTTRFYFNKPKDDLAGILRILVFDSCRDNPFKLAIAES
jgi:class 3 adenylate cyclase